MTRSRLARRAIAAATLGMGSFGCAAAPQTLATMPNVVAPAATPPGANMLGVAPGGGPPGPVTVWQKLGVGKQQLEFCRRKHCESPIGQLMGRAIAPMSALSGGLIPPFCSPIPTLAQLLDPGAIGANSKVKMDAANAEARKKAVEELANVDCHYWPEAEDALIGALRADRNECVRHTAALALNRGCCCTKKTIEALNICVSGSEADGHPCEKSPRVRAAAALALEHCLERACCPTCPIPEGAVPVVPVEEKKSNEEKPKVEGEEKKKEAAPDPKPTDISMVKPSPYAEELDDEAQAKKTAKAYYANIKKTKTKEQLLVRAKQVLATMPPLPVDLSIPAGHPDYEAAGVRTGSAAAQDGRPANVLDMLTGANMKKPMTTAMPASAKTLPAATGEAPLAPPKVEAPVKAAVPVPVNVEPPKLDLPKAMPVAEPKPAVKAANFAPVEKIDTKTAATPIYDIPRIVKNLEAPNAGTASNGNRVMRMFGESTEVLVLCNAVDSLTASDLKDQPLVNAKLLSVARDDDNPRLRVCCLKALARGKCSEPQVVNGLQTLTASNDKAVAQQAKETMKVLKAGK